MRSWVLENRANNRTNTLTVLYAAGCFAFLPSLTAVQTNSWASYVTVSSAGPASSLPQQSVYIEILIPFFCSYVPWIFNVIIAFYLTICLSSLKRVLNTICNVCLIFSFLPLVQMCNGFCYISNFIAANCVVRLLNVYIKCVFRVEEFLNNIETQHGVKNTRCRKYILYKTKSLNTQFRNIKRSNRLKPLLVLNQKQKRVKNRPKYVSKKTK